MAAPVAYFDEHWPILGDLDMVSDQRLLPLKGRVSAAEEAAAAPRSPRQDGGFSPGETGASRPTEELVDGFDEQLSACFRDVKAGTDSIAPASVLADDSLLERDEVWNALTRNYGRVMPVDWRRSRVSSLHVPMFNPEEKRADGTAAAAAELSDDEELREQLDMHSIIVSCLAEEPLFTAEQVIEEIEEMMRDSPDMEVEQNPSRSDLSMVSLDVQRTAGYEKGVRTLSVAALNERLEQTEANIRGLSEELVRQLALRDELDFDKEVKNSFISALIDVQNRQKEHRELLRKRRKIKSGAGSLQGRREKTLGTRFSMEGLSSALQNRFRQAFRSGCTERQYLTTVIPYENKGHPPSLEDLQVLTKILQAMRDDSDKVPGLLTDYILKVLCPT